MIAATLLVAGAVAAPAVSIPPAIFAAALFIAMVGLADDIKSIPVLPRLLLQAQPSQPSFLPRRTRIKSLRPARCGSSASCSLAGVWFVNLVNFMDGIDWMTVAEAVPITAAMVLLAG